MKTASLRTQFDLTIDIAWKHDGISHLEHYYADQFNCWRDIFPGSLFEILLNGIDEDTRTIDVSPGEIVPAFRNEKVIVFPRARLNLSVSQDQFRRGRFYPQGILTGIPGIFRENVTPFRCIGLDGEAITADLNHPMAKRPLSVTLTIQKQSFKPDERGGSCTDWMDLALSGPGMQVRFNRQPTDFLMKNWFYRKDTRPDPLFYATDRFVQHIDSLARQKLAEGYRSFMKSGDRILDLMGSWDSHLPEDLSPSYVHGLGLNRNELERNRQLSEYTLQDLNSDPTLHFDDHSFDAVICSLSIEYLIDPITVFREVSRILRPGGMFVVTFSNRWFPEKAIQIWENLHDFERMGLVTEYFLESGGYESVSTMSVRGYPRPCDDRHFPELRLSDPVYMVAGSACKK